jgi:ribonuclease PH
MRVDGRKPDELRPIRIDPNFTIYAEGSVLITMGGTKVLCNATVEDNVPRWIKVGNIPGGWITGEYAMLPRSTQTRAPREVFRPAGRTQEIRRLIGRCLRAAVDLEKLGQRTCIVDCDVIQADGGTRTAAITGGYVALALALKKLIAQELIPADTIISPVAAISVGVVEQQPLLDLCYEEDSRAQTDANIIMNAKGEFIEIQSTAESKPFSRSILDTLLDLASRGIEQILPLQKSALEE